VSDLVKVGETDFEGEAVGIYFNKEAEHFQVPEAAGESLGFSPEQAWQSYHDALNDVDLALRQRRLLRHSEWRPYVVVSCWKRNNQHGHMSVVLNATLLQREVLFLGGKGYHRHAPLGPIGQFSAQTLAQWETPSPDGVYCQNALWIPQTPGILEQWQAKFKALSDLYDETFPEALRKADS
jgi:hypothetical protein